MSKHIFVFTQKVPVKLACRFLILSLGKCFAVNFEVLLSGVDLTSIHVVICGAAGGTKERPWSAILSPDEHSSLTLPSSRRPTSIMAFHGNNLSKSLSIHNIAGYGELEYIYLMLGYNYKMVSSFFFIQTNV